MHALQRLIATGFLRWFLLNAEDDFRSPHCLHIMPRPWLCAAAVRARGPSLRGDVATSGLSQQSARMTRIVDASASALTSPKNPTWGRCGSFTPGIGAGEELLCWSDTTEHARFHAEVAALARGYWIPRACGGVGGAGAVRRAEVGVCLP